jgi:dTDP-4-amino-4,6-dideoxygalactose transaminase
LCLVEAGVGPGDEVITSPITFASTGNTVLNMGARMVFADIDPDTLNISPAAIEAAITDRTKVIMPVHMAGQPCDMDAIAAIGEKHGIPIVEDAAHALGARYRGKPIGSVSDFSCFSFYAIKNITTMEGGMVAVRDGEAAERIRRLATNGMSANAWDRYGRSAVPAPAEVVAPGYKYLMGNVSAAMGLEQLRKFPKFKAARGRLARLYRSALAEIDEISLPCMTEDVEHSWHLMIIRLNLELLNKTRDEIAFALRQENVGTGVHFLGLHLHQYYRETLGMKPEDFPEATAASSQILSLPLYPGLTDKNVHEVVAALKKVLQHAR